MYSTEEEKQAGQVGQNINISKFLHLLNKIYEASENIIINTILITYIGNKYKSNYEIPTNYTYPLPHITTSSWWPVSATLPREDLLTNYPLSIRAAEEEDSSFSTASSPSSASSDSILNFDTE